MNTDSTSVALTEFSNLGAGRLVTTTVSDNSWWISMGGASSKKNSAPGGVEEGSGSGSGRLAITVVALTRRPSSVRPEIETDVTPL